MKLADIKAIAGTKGIKAAKLTKLELVRAIQVAEGNPACYANGQSDSCNQPQCLWKEDCR